MRTTLSKLALGALLAIGPATSHAQATHLAAAGPVDPANGYPIWYQDSTGRTLELCLDVTADLLCLLDPAVDLPNPAAPVSFPGNFPIEAFWWAAGASLETATGKAILTLALEAAFLPEVVAWNNEIAFGRVRVRFQAPGPGTYVVTHPYGRDTFTVGPGDDPAIFFTEDIGADVPRRFDGALASRIDPFLTVIPDADCPAPPPGYVGDSASLCRVAGSATGFFRIEGPGIAPARNDNPCPDQPASPDCVQVDRFTITGKEATRFGVGVTRATYARGAWDPGIEIFAYTRAPGATWGIPEQVLQASVSGVATPLTLTTDGSGRYFGFVVGDFAPDTTVTVTNQGDALAGHDTAARGVGLVDRVWVVEAYYFRTTSVLEVVARGSDEVSGATLSAYDAEGKLLGALVPGAEGLMLVLPNVVVPPREVTVRSSLGGSATVVTDVGLCARAGTSQKCIPPPPR